MQSQLRHWKRRQNGRWLRGSAEELVSVWRQWLLLVVAGFRVLQEQHADRQAKAGCLAPQNHEHWSMQGGKGAHDHRGANCGKSTVLDPIRSVFGKAAVLGKPKLGAANGALSRMAKGNIRFVYFDDYRPVDYAAHPKENPTVPVTDFLAMFCGQPFNIQVSQSFNDGHPDMEYHRGAAMTAKEEGLWDPIGSEDGRETP